MLIAVCGIDGAGKTTNIQKIKSVLEKEHEIYLTKQPTAFYRGYDRFRKYVNNDIQKEREVLYELALISAADRMRHYNMEILPNKNKIVICDRYLYSCYAYFMARGLEDITWLKEINKWSLTPDVTIYLDVMPQKALKRIEARDGRSYKKEERDMKVMEKVRNCFLEQPWGGSDSYYIIDAEQDERIIHKQIMDIIEKYL